MSYGILCSEEAAKKSIYSVSTKYYYAFSCKVPENLTHKIKCKFSGVPSNFSCFCFSIKIFEHIVLTW